MRKRRLVTWNSKEDCMRYYKNAGYSFALDDMIERHMRFGSRIEFRDDEQIERFHSLYDAKVI